MILELLRSDNINLMLLKEHIIYTWPRTIPFADFVRMEIVVPRLANERSRFVSSFRNFMTRTRTSSGCFDKQQWHGGAFAVINVGIFMKRRCAGERRGKNSTRRVATALRANVRRIRLQRIHLAATIRECIFSLVPQFFPSDIQKSVDDGGGGWTCLSA